MISKLENGSGRWRFVLRPNCSATWTEIKIFFGLISAVSVSIAAGFAWLGFWPVLPFAGAELALLWTCLCYSASNGRTTEVIDINEDTVAIERGRSRPQQRWRFQRAWATIRLEPAAARLHPSRLSIGSHGRSVRLGAFLTEDERRALALDLTHTLART